jgi:hypothetical protein
MLPFCPLQLDAVATLNLFDALVIMVPGVATIFLAWRVRNAVFALRVLTSFLALFLVVHGINHFLAFYDDVFNSDWADFLGNAIVKPLSWAIMVAFGAYYLKKAG